MPWFRSFWIEKTRKRVVLFVFVVVFVVHYGQRARERTQNCAFKTPKCIVQLPNVRIVQMQTYYPAFLFLAPHRTRVGTRLIPDLEPVKKSIYLKSTNVFQILSFSLTFKGLVWTTMAPTANAEGLGWPYLAPLYQSVRPVAQKMRTGLLYPRALVLRSGTS